MTKGIAVRGSAVSPILAWVLSVHLIFAHQIQDRTGVERAAGAHHEPIHRAQAHCACCAAALFHGAQACAIAQMGQDDASRRQFRRQDVQHETGYDGRLYQSSRFAEYVELRRRLC
jgi:hypothetical protein